MTVVLAPALLLRSALLAALAGLIFAAAPAEAAAATIKVVVNGTAITDFDVRSRINLMKLTGGKVTSEKAVMEELVDEILKQREAARYGLKASEAQVNQAFASMAAGVKLTPAKLSQVLLQRGINPETLKQRIRTQIVWGQLVRGKFKSAASVAESDVEAAIAAKKAEGKAAATQYKLQQIIFVLPSGASAGAAEARRREAEALRGRFTDCDSGVALARGLRDVAVKEPVTRLSTQMSPAFLEEVKRTKIGRATKPDRSQQGVEIVAVCEANDVQDDSAIRLEVQKEKGDDLLEQKANQYLADLRSKAIIQYR